MPNIYLYIAMILLSLYGLEFLYKSYASFYENKWRAFYEALVALGFMNIIYHLYDYTISSVTIIIN